MKAMAFSHFGEPLEMVSMADPVPGNGEVVLSVRGCGVCRTDLKVIRGLLPITRRAPMPLAPGHEIVGVVESVGLGVDGWRAGDRAVVYFYVGCGRCSACLVGKDQLCANLRHQIGFDVNGGYAEKLIAPARNLVRISSALSDGKAAIIPDAIATAVHAVLDRAEVKPGDRVLVVGAGGVGIHAAQLALLSGAYAIVVDVDEAKLAMAEEVGVDETYLIGSLRHLPPSVRVNKVIEASGALREFTWVASSLENGGTLVLVGYTVGESLTLGSTDLISGEFEIRGSRASSLPNLTTAVELVERGKVRPMVDCVFPLAEANEVLARLDKGDLNGRAVLVPQ